MTTAMPALCWNPAGEAPAFEPQALIAASRRMRERAWILRDPRSGRLGVGFGGTLGPAGVAEVVGALPALMPQSLGDPAFCATHRVRLPYVAGEMAGGIATCEMVIAMAQAGMLGFFGAGGLPLPAVEAAVERLQTSLGPRGLAWGINLIHNLHDPAAEDSVVDLFLRRGVERVCASAFLQVTAPVVRYAISGIHQDAQGRIVRPRHLFAKLSRPEVAAQFMGPAPASVLAALVDQGRISRREAELAAHVPLAQDITVEGDSGGHTDNRPLVGLFPVITKQAAELQARHGYATPVRVGAAGGLGTPASVAAAFALGAAYVVTGSVNQAAVESGLSPAGRALLAQAAIDEVAMAPAADMFELGARVQVLKRGTLFAPRAQRLQEIYRLYPGIDAIPPADRQRLEKEVFRMPLSQVWAQTQAYFATRDPGQVDRAAREPKHQMALVFRWYLGQASRWARDGQADRAMDYQIWCGPAMGAFNAWTRGSVLEDPAQRTVVQIALNLMEGAAVVLRAQQLRSYGLPVPAAAFDVRPRLIT